MRIQLKSSLYNCFYFSKILPYSHPTILTEPIDKSVNIMYHIWVYAKISKGNHTP